MKRIHLTFLSALLAGLLTWPALAWQLAPEGTAKERKLAALNQTKAARFFGSVAHSGVSKVGQSVHEEITNRSLGCEGTSAICADPDDEPDNAYFIAGARWNDDPPFIFGQGQGGYAGCRPGQTVRLVTQPLCWYNVFRAAEKEAAAGKVFDGRNATLLVRSHFGDMQFLHSMASADGETPQHTQRRILAWAEFTWAVALGEMPMDQTLHTSGVDGFDEVFAYNREWRVQDLFALGNPQMRQPDRLSRVALGSLMHLVQDSFAAGHVERQEPTPGRTCPGNPQHPQPGAVMEFHAYGGQNHASHKDSDTHGAFEQHMHSVSPGAVQVGQALYAFYVNRKPWAQVRPYMECVFALHPLARAASPGVNFQ